MATQNVFTRASSGVRHIFQSILRVFAPEHDDYPETGTRPLEHDIYKEKKDKSHRFH